MQQPTIESILNVRFLVVAGKGGVGRTTVAAALARAAAARGKRVLIAQANAAERLGKLLGRPGPIGPAIITIGNGIDAVNMTPREALHEYALMVLRFEFAYRAIFENRAMRGFLNAVPGLDGYAMFGKAYFHATEMVRGRPRYDLVILDGPASGHIVPMLRLPEIVLETMPRGPLGKDARAARELLSDPQRAAMVIVSLAEELPVRETLELVAAARDVLRVALGPIVANALPSSRFNDGGVCDVLDRVALPTGDSHLDPTLSMARGLRARRTVADELLSRLRTETGLPVVELPRLFTTDMGRNEVDRLADLLAPSSLTPTRRPA